MSMRAVVAVVALSTMLCRVQGGDGDNDKVVKVLGAIRALYEKAQGLPHLDMGKEWLAGVDGETKKCVINAVDTYSPLLTNSKSCMAVVGTLLTRNGDLNTTAIIEAVCLDGACASLFFKFADAVQKCASATSDTHLFLGQQALVAMFIANPDATCEVVLGNGATCVTQIQKVSSDISKAGCGVIDACVVPFLPLIEQNSQAEATVPWDMICQLCPADQDIMRHCDKQSTMPPNVPRPRPETFPAPRRTQPRTQPPRTTRPRSTRRP